MNICTWHEEDGTWATDCGKAFDINAGYPSENDMIYCCFCGGTIKEFPEDSENT